MHKEIKCNEKIMNCDVCNGHDDSRKGCLEILGNDFIFYLQFFFFFSVIKFFKCPVIFFSCYFFLLTVLLRKILSHRNFLKTNNSTYFF